MTKNHDENCECGSGDHEHFGCDHEEEMDIIYLTLDDDTELECNVLGTFEVDDYEYIALVPMDDDQVLLYRFKEDEDGIDLLSIEDDEEFEIVSDAFYEMFVEEDLDFLDDEDFDDEDFEDEYFEDEDDEE